MPRSQEGSSRVFGLEHLHFLKPRFQAALLMSLLDRDARAPNALREIISRARRGEPEAVAVCKHLRRLTGPKLDSAIISGTLAPTMAKRLLPLMPPEMMTAATVLISARSGNSEANSLLDAVRRKKTVIVHSARGPVRLGFETFQRAATVLNTAETKSIF